MATTQADIILAYFKQHPKRKIAHPEIVDWCEAEYMRQTGKKFRDPDRAIRKLHQQGILIKHGKGIYEYDPEAVQTRELEDFSEEQKQAILARDNYRCVVCGRGQQDGVELHVDHIKPKDKGGKATLENGQTLCAEHNFRKKNYSQTESGKRMFIRLLDLARAQDDKAMEAFCRDILKVYDKHRVNGHIEWQE